VRTLNRGEIGEIGEKKSDEKVGELENGSEVDKEEVKEVEESGVGKRENRTKRLGSERIG